MAKTAFKEVSDFIHTLSWGDIPDQVKSSAKRSLIDLLATHIAGTQTASSRLVRDFCLATFNSGQAWLAFDGRQLAPAGAALANATTLDSMDAHDGHRLAKGHVGAGTLAAVLATIKMDQSGIELLLRMIIGYEIGLRAALSLHSSSQTYHSSGAWVALAASAVTARAKALNLDQTQHALGIAEYHGPRSPMMRCIDHPTMVKDGTGWGCMTGLMATQMAAAGYTGSPAELISLDTGANWSSLGDQWRFLETYYKPYPICRWAQPAVSAALTLQRENQLEPAEIESVDVKTFGAASRLNHPEPTSTEEAQYSLPFPLAMSLVKGRLDPVDVLEDALENGEVLSLARRVHISVDSAMEDAFPEQTLAQVSITTNTGVVHESAIHNAPGDVTSPLSDETLIEKYKRYTLPLLGSNRAEELLRHCQHLERDKDLSAFINLVRPAMRAASS